MSSDITLSSAIALSTARYRMSSCDRKAPTEFSKLLRDIQESLSLMVTNRAALWRSKIWFRYVCFPEHYILRELIFTERERERERENNVADQVSPAWQWCSTLLLLYSMTNKLNCGVFHLARFAYSCSSVNGFFWFCSQVLRISFSLSP